MLCANSELGSMCLAYANCRTWIIQKRAWRKYYIFAAPTCKLTCKTSFLLIARSIWFWTSYFCRKSFWITLSLKWRISPLEKSDKLNYWMISCCLQLDSKTTVPQLKGLENVFLKESDRKWRGNKSSDLSKSVLLALLAILMTKPSPQGISWQCYEINAWE